MPCTRSGASPGSNSPRRSCTCCSATHCNSATPMPASGCSSRPGSTRPRRCGRPAATTRSCTSGTTGSTAKAATSPCTPRRPPSPAMPSSRCTSTSPPASPPCCPPPTSMSNSRPWNAWRTDRRHSSSACSPTTSTAAATGSTPGCSASSTHSWLPCATCGTARRNRPARASISVATPGSNHCGPKGRCWNRSS